MDILFCCNEDYSETNIYLFNHIVEAANFEKRQKILLDSYLKYHFKGRENDSHREIYMNMMDKIITTAGETSVAAMAEEMVYSERYINKVFNEFARISPKKYCNLMRFQYLL